MPFGPVRAMWDGDRFVPLKRFLPQLNKDCVVHELYTITEIADRDMVRHRGYFAFVNEAFDSLPEEWGTFFKNADHLRKWALIQTKYCSHKNFVFDTPGDAERFAGYVREHNNDFQVVQVSGNVVVVYTAESQQVLRNGKGMDAERFKTSISAVRHYLEGMLGIRP